MWFFNRKKEDDKWAKLHLTLRNSFSMIKRDMEETHIKVDTKNKEQDQEIEELKRKIDLIVAVLEDKPIQQQVAIIEDKYEVLPTKQEAKDLLDNLTNTQKTLLLRLNILLHESGEDWVSMKYLTQELYPNKNYEDVKSMVSNYTDTLLGFGLIEKKRKGRQIYLNLTEKTKKILPKRKNPKIKVIDKK